MHNRAESPNVFSDRRDPSSPAFPASVFLICVALAAVTIAAFWPVTHAEFVSIDDPIYVGDNLRVQQGLTADNARWAFTTFYFSNWHPLTWLSYMLDCQMFGVSAPAMHRVNLGLHVVNALALFLMLRRMTRALWRSAVVAALFALHPLHVESVAWISERKDVLSTLFLLLTVWSYAEYAQRRCAGWYTAAVVFFALGLMAKAMLVTLPFALLLVDLWPLRRIDVNAPSWWAQPRLLVEKLPFFILAGVSSYLTFAAQRRGESVASFEALAFAERVENAVVSYARYLGKTIWPSDLSVFYPHPGSWAGMQVASAAVLLVAISAAAVLLMRRFPFLFFGWFWFVGTLVPVVGLVQVGGQSIADRYMYVPSIGLFVAITWCARALFGRLAAPVAAVPAFAVILVCAGLTWQQTQHWQDSLALFTHAARVTPPSGVVLNNLGDALLDQGRTQEANAQFRKALELNPKDVWALGNVANSFLREGKVDDALAYYRKGLRLASNIPQLHYNVGVALVAKGEFAEAMIHYQRALQLNPFYLDAQLNLGNALMLKGDYAAALTNYVRVLELKPDLAGAHYNVGNVALAQNRPLEAERHFAEVIRLDPQFVDAFRRRAVALENLGRLGESRQQLERAATLRPSDPGIRSELAMVLAKLGRTKESIDQYREALRHEPSMLNALNNLAWLLATHPDATIRDAPEAVRMAEQAVEIGQRRFPVLHGTLGAAYAEAGRFQEAIKAAEEAIELAQRNGVTELVEKNRQLLAAYQQGRPWRETNSNAKP